MDATIKLNPVNGNWQVSEPHLKLAKDSGAHVLTFDIVGNSNGITFDPQDPLWIQMGSKPNTQPQKGSDNGQIGGPKILNNGKQLVIVDWNDVPGQLYYHMNFKGYAPLDPIIDNGGGVKPPFMNYANYLSYAAIALVAFFLGMLVYRSIVAFRRRSPAGAGTTEKTG
jgi:hypothetical protein